MAPTCSYGSTLRGPSTFLISHDIRKRARALMIWVGPLMVELLNKIESGSFVESNFGLDKMCQEFESRDLFLKDFCI